MNDDMMVKLMMIAMIIIVALVGLSPLYARLCADKVEATISEIIRYKERQVNSYGHDYNTFVNYEYNGQVYEGIHLDYHQKGYKKGQKINVYIFPTKPDKPHGGSIACSILFLSVAAFFAWVYYKVF